MSEDIDEKVGEISDAVLSYIYMNDTAIAEKLVGLIKHTVHEFVYELEKDEDFKRELHILMENLGEGKEKTEKEEA